MASKRNPFQFPGCPVCEACGVAAKKGEPLSENELMAVFKRAAKENTGVAPEQPSA